jgi:polyisoprenoid-binding protein YceI
MQKIRIAAAALALAGTALAARAAPEAYELDSTHTFPSFEVNHLGFSTMRGSFLSTSGTLTYDADKHTGSVEATINTASISTGFGQRDNHLRSKDFFDVDKYPTMTFKADDFTVTADKATPVNGSLTLLGQTHPVSLSVQLTKCAMRMDKKYVCGAMVSGQLKRSDWGMTMFTPFIGDDIKMQIEVEAMKK